MAFVGDNPRIPYNPYKLPFTIYRLLTLSSALHSGSAAFPFFYPVKILNTFRLQKPHSLSGILLDNDTQTSAQGHWFPRFFAVLAIKYKFLRQCIVNFM